MGEVKAERGKSVAPLKAASPRTVAAASRSFDPVLTSHNQIGNAALTRLLHDRVGPGRPLDAPLRGTFETRLGHDLSDVRVHTSPAASEAARALHARAFTYGTDVAFATGRFAPDTGDGQRLIAHELTHVIQQRDDPDAPRIQRQDDESPDESDEGEVKREPPPPSDVNLPSFILGDIRNRLVRAIDQTETQVGTFMRHVDFPAVVAALSDLTAAEVRQVEDSYEAYEGRKLRYDLFGLGDSGARTDLTEDQQHRIEALLGGTRATEPSEMPTPPEFEFAAGDATLAAAARKQDADLARLNRLDADAAELHALLHGDRGEAAVEQVMGILKRDARNTSELVAAYQRLYHPVVLAADLAKLSPTDLVRATMVMTGASAAADTVKVAVDQSRIAEIDKKIAGLEQEARDGDAFAYLKIQGLKEERKLRVADIEQRAQQAADEGREQDPLQGEDAAHQAAMTRTAAVLGDVDKVASTLKGSDAEVVRALASDDPVAKVAARLKRSAANGTLTASEITAALRGLRHEAEKRATAEAQAEFMAEAVAGREPSRVTQDEIDARTEPIAADYFGRLRDAYDALAAVAFDEVLKTTGDKTEQELNQRLLSGHGHLDDVVELEIALRGDRKDLETVKRVLKFKSAAEIKILKAKYEDLTKRTLDHDLFGDAPTHANEENPEAAGVYLKNQGKATGTDRLLLEDYMQRPEQEGGAEEADYIAARAEREYQYTIDNRGATGWWRDKWGSETKSLLDDTIETVRNLHDQFKALVQSDPKQADSAKGRELIQEMQLARATIRGDRAAYEQANAELRATFQFVASLAVQAALMVALGPVFSALTKLAEAAEAAGAVATRIGAWVTKASLSTASNIYANATAYGSEYTRGRLKADLLGGFGAAAGVSLAEKLVGPVANGIADALGARKGAAGFRDLASRLAPGAERLERNLANDEIASIIRTVGGAEGASLIQGDGLTLDFEALIKQHVSGKAVEFGVKMALPPSTRGPEPPAPSPPEAAPSQAAATKAPDAPPPMILEPVAPAPVAAPEPRPSAAAPEPSPAPTPIEAPATIEAPAPTETPAPIEAPAPTETPAPTEVAATPGAAPELPVTPRAKTRPLTGQQLRQMKAKFEKGKLTNKDVARLAEHHGLTPAEMNTWLIETVRAQTIQERRQMASGSGDVESEIFELDVEPRKQAGDRRPNEPRPAESPEVQETQRNTARVKASQRRIARKQFGRMLQEALTDPETHSRRSLGMQELTRESIKHLTEGQKRYVRKTGKIPRGLEFHHLMTVAGFPEYAHLPEVGLALPKEVHTRVGHGGNTFEPIEALTYRDPTAMEAPGFVESHGPMQGALKENRGRMEWHEEQARAARKNAEAANQRAAAAETDAAAARQSGDKQELKLRERDLKLRQREARKFEDEARDHEIKAGKIRKALPTLAQIRADASPEARRDLGRPARIPQETQAVAPTEDVPSSSAAEEPPATTPATSPPEASTVETNVKLERIAQQRNDARSRLDSVDNGILEIDGKLQLLDENIKTASREARGTLQTQKVELQRTRSALEFKRAATLTEQEQLTTAENTLREGLKPSSSLP